MFNKHWFSFPFPLISFTLSIMHTKFLVWNRCLINATHLASSSLWLSSWWMPFCFSTHGGQVYLKKAWERSWESSIVDEAAIWGARPLFWTLDPVLDMCHLLSSSQQPLEWDIFPFCESGFISNYYFNKTFIGNHTDTLLWNRQQGHNCTAQGTMLSISQ